MFWKTAEFSLGRYKDIRDAYVLGSTDDIQQLYDESMVNLLTILSSKYVAPIKARVDEWIKQLDLFNKTLVR